MCRKKDKQEPVITVQNKESDFPIKKGETEMLLHLMEIYLSEWEHRDSHFWSQAFAYFTATLTITVLPFFDFWQQTDIFKSVPRIVFPIVGIVMTVVFICTMFAYYKRTEASYSIYRKLIDMLPTDYQEDELKKKYQNTDHDNQDKKNTVKTGVKIKMFFNRIRYFFVVHSISKIGIIVMFIILIGIAAVVIASIV